MNKETPKVKNPLAMLVMTAIIIACVGYLYSQVLSAYQAGGAEAPSLAMVIISGILLGGGCVYVVSMAVRIYLQSRREEKQNNEEHPEA